MREIDYVHSRRVKTNTFRENEPVILQIREVSRPHPGSYLLLRRHSHRNEKEVEWNPEFLLNEPFILQSGKNSFHSLSMRAIKIEKNH